MKRIKDKSFLLILVLSIITLIALTIGVIFLTRKSSREFYSAGYIINSTASKSDKYYFNENTVYKENIFNEYTFKDVDNKEVSTSKDNFIHYLDESLSFMKNGVILDLDNFNEKLVPYYNVTDNVILKYSNGGYIVETNDKTLVFGNLLGRITDDKYIVLGSDVRIVLAGNEEAVKGKYFELLFVEDGIVKVENNEGSYQTTTEGTIIFIGDNIRIDLGSKKVFYAEEEKLTLDEMTINGNENINIDTSKVKEENKDNNGTGTGDGTTSNPSDSQGGNDNTDIPGDSEGTGTSGSDDTVQIKKEVSVDLVKALLDINSLNATIQVIDTMEAIKGNLILTLYDVDNNKTEYTKLLATTSDLQEIVVNSLSPNTNYYMSIKDSEGYEYLTRNLRTSNLDISLKREMVTTNSISYSVDFSNDDNVKSATISLYDEDNKLINSYTADRDNNSVEFTDLESNKNYNVILDNVIFKNTSYSEVYTINTMVQTLKEKPILGNINVKANEDAKTFELIMEEPIDKDNSISNYIYKIYDIDTITEDNIDTITPVYTFSTVNLKNEVLKLGENGLLSNKNYVYKVTIRYYDNYKENEVDTGLSLPFIIAGLPSISFEEKEIDFNSIYLLLTLKDEGCTIPVSGRKDCTYQGNITDKSDIYIKYYTARGTDEKYIGNVVFDPETLTYDLKVSGLSENTTYTFEVWGNYDLYNDKGLQINKLLGTYTVTTAGMENLTMSNWKKNNYSPDTPISVNTELINTIPSSTIIDKLESFKIKLHKGDTITGEILGSYDVIGNDNIKSNYYNKPFNINSSQFGITDINHLRELSGGKLSRYYTIEIADAYDANMTNEFNIQNNTFIYEVPAILLLEDEATAPEVLVEEITKKQAAALMNEETGDEDFIKAFEAAGININYLNNDTIIAYKVTANFDKNKVASYFQGTPIRELNFYANMDGKTIEKKIINFAENEEYTTYFILKDGTDYSTTDTELRRGNTYTFTFDMNIDTDNNEEGDTLYPDKKSTSASYTSNKQEPRINMYVDNSTKDTITYKYSVVDYDNALVKEEDKYLIHYTIGESEEEYTTEIINTASMEEFTLENLTNSTIYNLYYNKALTKKDKPSAITSNYYFDGYHNANEYNLGYKLEYYDFDNILTINLGNNDFLNRVSAYLVTLTAGDLKYEKVISSPSVCGEEENIYKCIKIDYADISNFKGKDITVKVEAFYDTGYSGFSSKSLLGDYFKDLGYVSDKDASKVGYVFQQVGTTEMGKYYYIYKNNSGNIEPVISDTPKGILGIETNIQKESYKQSSITTNNLVDIVNLKFINYGEIKSDPSNIDILTNGIKLKSHDIYIVPKVLDKAEIQTTNNSFKFTSIIPKVETEVKPLINGGIVDIKLSIDENTLDTDFVKTDGKYKFYIDIYNKDEEGNEVFIKSVETDYDNLTNISFADLNPDSTYYYKISADMNKNGKKVKTSLFENDDNGYIEYAKTLKTLGKDEVFKKIEYSFSSTKGEETYSQRTLKVNVGLKSKENINVKFELYDINDNLEREGIIVNSDISSNNTAIFTTDISGKDFVFGYDYHRLVVTAVTTDAEPKELELYNGFFKNVNKYEEASYFRELKEPVITLTQGTGINVDETTSGYDYYIDYKIVVEDTDRVINDGKFYVELEDSNYNNVCTNPDDCQVEIDLYNLTCNTKGTNSRVNSCSVIGGTDNNSDAANTFTIYVTYNDLEPDTNYFIYAYADIYRNNLSLDDTAKESIVYVRKGQYTRSSLNFSLGSPTLTAKDNKLIMTFVGSTNIPDSIKGIVYNVNEEGAGKIASGTMGLIPSGTSTSINDAIKEKDLIYSKVENEEYPYIEIPIPSDKKLGKTNFITITYYYESNGNLEKLSINGKDIQQYYVKDVS